MSEFSKALDIACEMHADPTDAEVEAALWAWISSAAEGVTSENVSPRVLDLNRPRARAALLAARKAAPASSSAIAAHDQEVAERRCLKICWHIDRLVEHADQMTRSDLLVAVDNLSVTADSIARGEGDAHRPERCPTCGCELAYPTAVHVVDCGEGSE